MRIYIETSVISFCFDREERNRDKQECAARLLRCCRERVHHGFVSYVVIGEIEKSKEPFRTRDLEFIVRSGLSEVPVDRAAVERLADAYRQEKALRHVPKDDLLHIAIFSLSDLESLVTYNLRHIANRPMLKVVRKVNYAQGIFKEIDVAQPETFPP